MKLFGLCHFAAGNNNYITTIHAPADKDSLRIIFELLFQINPCPKSIQNFSFPWKISRHCGHIIMSFCTASPETNNKNYKSRLKTPGTTKVLKLYLIMRTGLKADTVTITMTESGHKGSLRWGYSLTPQNF